MQKTTRYVIALTLFIQSIAMASLTAPRVGKLTQSAAGTFEFLDPQGLSEVTFSPAVASEIPSLIGKAPYVEIRQGASQVPTIVSGDRVLEGRLMRSTKGTQETYSINGTFIEFGRTKKVIGTEFDSKSRDYFVGRSVRAIGYNKKGLFILQSIVRLDVFSADVNALSDPDLPAAFESTFDKDPVRFISEMMRGKIRSPSPFWFRKSIFNNAIVRAGDPVLLITASGAEVDGPGSVNGHFAVGLGHVGPDAIIRGELFNFYVTNEKEITPGNLNLNDYYGHLVWGQQNYRPTYTLVLYGIPESQILRVKAEMDRFHRFFRQGSSKITESINCASISVQALADIQIYGEHRNSRVDTNRFQLLSAMKELPPKLNFAEKLAYVAKTRRAEFMPAPAFLSLARNLDYLNQVEHLGITRADFIFGGQTPSARVVGKAPTMGLFKTLSEQAGVLSKHIGIRKIKPQ